MCNVHPARCILIMIEIPFLYNTIYIPQVFALNPFILPFFWPDNGNLFLSSLEKAMEKAVSSFSYAAFFSNAGRIICSLVWSTPSAIWVYYASEMRKVPKNRMRRCVLHRFFDVYFFSSMIL